MKHVGRVVAAVLLVFVVAVVWYARAGEAIVMRRVFTNAAGIPEGTVWVRSDKGLFGGPVTAIASLSADGVVVYAGTREDEIYVSSDGGRDWTPLGGSLSGHYVAGIELDPRASGRVIGKAVYGAGFFLSEDGGLMWKNTSRGLGSRSLSCLASPAGSPDTLFAGTGDAGLFISRDGGRLWSRTGRQALGDRIAVVDVSRDGRTVYTGTQETGLFVSRDGGDTWNAIVLPFGSQLMVTGIDIDPRHRDWRRNRTFEGRRPDVGHFPQGFAPVRLCGGPILSGRRTRTCHRHAIRGAVLLRRRPRLAVDLSVA